MAITGSGTQDDPYIVHDWDEFVSINTSSYTLNYVNFANIHVDANGDIDMSQISGTGTEQSPYIVSTFAEMLFVTTAKFIWQVKLINQDNKIYQYRKLVGYGEHDVPIYRDIFCEYKASPSTIDFNDIYPNGCTETIVLYPKLDANGWTFKNLVLKVGGSVRFYTPAQKNFIFSNLYIENYSSSPRLYIDENVETSIFQIYSNNTLSSAISIFYCRDEDSRCLYNSSISIVARGNTSIGGGRFLNCSVYIDFSSPNYQIFLGNMEFKNCVVTGTISAKLTSNSSIADYLINSVFDITFEDSAATTYHWLMTSNVLGASFYNSDKFLSDSSYLTAPLLYAANTTQIHNRQWLHDHGLPIGVDD